MGLLALLLSSCKFCYHVNLHVGRGRSSSRRTEACDDIDHTVWDSCLHGTARNRRDQPHCSERPKKKNLLFVRHAVRLPAWLGLRGNNVSGTENLLKHAASYYIFKRLLPN
jgi:hypothetical protein